MLRSTRCDWSILIITSVKPQTTHLTLTHASHLPYQTVWISILYTNIGKIFIQSRILTEFGPIEVNKVAVLVNQLLASDEFEAQNGKKQMPILHSTLTKLLYLPRIAPKIEQAKKWNFQILF